MNHAGRAFDDRYQRQTLLAGIGAQGQARLAGASALIVGCGALGTAAAEMLARAGVGRLWLIDRDIVEPTNLQRQTLFDEADALAGTPKALAAQSRLADINSGCAVEALIADMSAANAEGLFETWRRAAETGAAVIIDATDNFETRYLLNDLAVKHATPLVYGAAVGVEGLCMTIVPGAGPCLRCVFEEPPAVGSAAASATCDRVGVLGPAPAIAANVQAAEAIKILSGRSVEASRVMLSFDLWRSMWRTIDISGARRPECPCCGEGRFEFIERAGGGTTIALCGRRSVQVTPEGAARGSAAAVVDLASLARSLEPHGPFSATRFLVRGSLLREASDAEDGTMGAAEPIELTVFADGRAIVKGTTRPERARALYAKYVGA